MPNYFSTFRTSESYVHRSGRTARSSREGLSLMLVDPSERQLVRRHCGNLGRSTDDVAATLPVFPVDSARLAAVAQRLVAARKLDKLLLEIRKENAGNNWRRNAAEEADLVISEDDDSDGEGERKVGDNSTNFITKVKISLEKRDQSYP